jgi:hypothetical protein
VAVEPLLRSDAEQSIAVRAKFGLGSFSVTL